VVATYIASTTPATSQQTLLTRFPTGLDDQMTIDQMLHLADLNKFSHFCPPKRYITVC